MPPSPELLYTVKFNTSSFFADSSWSLFLASKVTHGLAGSNFGERCVQRKVYFLIDGPFRTRKFRPAS